MCVYVDVQIVFFQSDHGISHPTYFFKTLPLSQEEVASMPFLLNLGGLCYWFN
jgi:hypothetical protein